MPDIASAQNSLVAAHGFNEGSGAATADASGNTNTAPLSIATWNGAGRYGSALTFDGTKDWVTIAEADVLDLTDAMTTEAWVHTSAVETRRTVLLKETRGGLSYGLYASDADGRPSGWIRGRSGIDATGPSSIPTKTWVHLAATYDGTTLILYVNGSQVAPKTITGMIVSSAEPFRIGGNATSGEYFAGSTDEVQIYNRALTAAEIEIDVNTPIAGGAPARDFSLSTSPSSRTITQGSTATYTVTVSALKGFAGTVDLSVNGLPSNATASFNPAVVNGDGTSMLTVTTTGSTPVGTSTLTITGTNGALTRTSTAMLVVNAPAPLPDFTISVTPASHTVVTGGAASYTVTVGALNGFTGTVDLTAAGLPAGASSSFNPPTIAGGGSATLTVTTAASTPPGTSSFTINGTSGSLTHGVSATLVINQASAGRVIGIDFVGMSTPIASTETAGVVPTANWNNATGATRTTPLALTDETGASSSATVTWTSNNTWSTPITNEAGNIRMMRGYLDTSDTSVTTVTVASLPNAAYDIYVYVDGDNGNVAKTAAYSLSGPGITATTIELTDAANTNFSATFTQAINSTGNYVKFGIVATGFTLTATPGASSGNRRAPVNGIQIVPTAAPSPDFSLSTSPSSRTIAQGSTATYTVTVSALKGFAGTVDLSVNGLPSNATASFAPPSVTGSGDATLTITTAGSTPTSTSTLTITGTSGSVTRATTATLIVNAIPVANYSISGVITPTANGAGALVTLGGAAVASTTANGGGAFSFGNLANGSYQVTPTKSGFVFTPATRTVAIAGANVTGVDFTATPSANTIAMSAPANGATVSNAFAMSATASASIVAVQFQVDGVNAGPEDASAPFSVSVTAPNGSHALRAIGRDASGNTVTSTAITVTVSGGSGTALAVNGTQTFQTIDGFGVNINSLSWKNGELIPTLDRLVDELGATTWRVVFDMMDWEASNDNADPTVADWTYYNALYSNAKFQSLWGTLRYLNQKGVTTGVALSFMGRVPPWMGGATITNTAQMEAEWVETVATLIYYARTTEQVQFDLVDPLNEPDWDGIEGPQVDHWRYPGLLQQLSAKLDAMGLSALKFVGPNTAQIGTGVNQYLPELFNNALVMSKLDHFGLHNYAGDAAGADATIKASPYPQKNFWITELSIPEQIFPMIAQGAAGAQIWDAYDSVYNHAILAGRGSTPPNDAGNLLPLLSYNTSTGTYSARPQFYQMQTFKYITPGSIRISATESNSNLTIYAFRHPTTGKVTLIGRNTGGSSITINGSLSGVGSVSALEFYRTSAGDNFGSFSRGSDAVVTNGSFVVTVPSNSFFTLTSPGQ